MFKKFSSISLNALARNFSTYYRFQNSFFNFAANINGKDIIDGEKSSDATQTITELYNKGVSRLIIRLKENHDEKDVIKIANQVKQLKENLPELEIQGFRYPMMFNQKTKLYLHNEFLFGLKASQMLCTKLFPQSFFIVESNDFFRSMINAESKEDYNKALFNLEMLEEAQKSLEFATLVYTMKYEDGQMNPENLKKFFEVYSTKNVAFDLELNKAFLKEQQGSKKKSTSDFIKFAYGFEPRIKALTLYDYEFVDQEVEAAKSTNEGENVAIPPGKFKRVELGEGVIDFKLVFDLIKISKYQGVLIFPEETSTTTVEKFINVTKEYEFQEQTEEQILQFLYHKEKLDKQATKSSGTETLF